jgi:hypothetical protein
MLTQLNPALPLITPKGKAWAVAVIDYSQEHDLIWVCFQDDDGSCWSWRNADIRLQPNITLGRAPMVRPKGDGWL